LLLGACGPANADATPTQSVQEIYTAAYQTIIAQQATQLALTPPTSTLAPPTLAPTLPPPSPAATFAFASSMPGGGGGVRVCDSSAYVSDVTIPDNSVVSAGKTFTKTWSLLNNGTCTWSTGYKLVYDSGDQMGGATSAVTVAVPAGAVGNVSVSLTAPTTNGTYTGTWRLQNPSGQSFGSFITVVIKVGSGATATAGPSPTAGAGMITISGTFNVDEVTLDFSGASSVPAVTYTGQDYSFTVPKGWSGTITPSRGNPGHWIFEPADKTFTNVKNDKTQDFTAIPVTPTPR
jgi:hypothetical protein